MHPHHPGPAVGSRDTPVPPCSLHGPPFPLRRLGACCSSCTRRLPGRGPAVTPPRRGRFGPRPMSPTVDTGTVLAPAGEEGACSWAVGRGGRRGPCAGGGGGPPTRSWVSVLGAHGFCSALRLQFTSRRGRGGRCWGPTRPLGHQRQRPPAVGSAGTGSVSITLTVSPGSESLLWNGAGSGDSHSTQGRTEGRGCSVSRGWCRDARLPCRPTSGPHTSHCPVATQTATTPVATRPGPVRQGPSSEDPSGASSRPEGRGARALCPGQCEPPDLGPAHSPPGAPVQEPAGQLRGDTYPEFPSPARPDCPPGSHLPARGGQAPAPSTGTAGA